MSSNLLVLLNSEHWFWSLVNRERKKYSAIILASLFINLFALLSALYVMTVYDRVIPSGSIDTLVALTVGVALVYFFDFAMKTTRGSLTDNAGEQIDLGVGERLFDLMERNYQLVSKHPVGAISSTVKDFDILKDFISSASFLAFADLPFSLFFVAALYLLAGPIAFIPLIILVAVVVVSLLVRPLTQKYSDEASVGGNTKNSTLVEMLGGVETLSTLQGVDLLRQRWMSALSQSVEVGKKLKRVSLFATNFSMLGQQSSQAVIVFFGVLSILDGELSMGALIGCVIISGRILSPMGQITGLLSKFSQAKSAYSSLNSFFSDEVNLDRNRVLTRRKKLDTLTLDRVTFSYSDANSNAIENLSFSIKAGEKVGIVGGMGGGKTTLVRLISGLLAPSSGSILLGGVEMSHLDPRDIRRDVSIVSQFPTLFSGSIKENILLGNPKASDEDLLMACQASGVSDFINSLDQGLETQLAERGQRLSGGQKQTIALARALICKPRVLILDEPTSSLDNASEAKLVDRLASATKNMTLIVISHRAPMLKLTPRLLVIESGRLRADGPRDEILVPRSSLKQASDTTQSHQENVPKSAKDNR